MQREMEVAVRLGFIDAPELEQPGGPQARDFLNQLIGGRWVDLAILTKMDTGQIVDRHGRIVAVPYLRQQRQGRAPQSVLEHLFHALTAGTEWRNVEIEMVLNGWAWVLDRYQPEQRYFDALEDAQRNRRGIWKWDDNVHPWEFKNNKYAERRRRDQRAPVRRASHVGNEEISCRVDGCGGVLVQRTGPYGSFYGCSRFPKCRYSCAHLD
jgi:endonuclease YncB( thermonuclease family)